MTRTLNLEYEEFMIGSDLSALTYCYNKKIPLVFIRNSKPYQYGFDENYEVEIKKWNHYMYMLSLNGFCPLADKAYSIRLEDDNNVNISTKTNFNVNIKFDKLVISDDYRVEGLPEIIGKSNIDNCVIDLVGVYDKYKLEPYIDTGMRTPQIIRSNGDYVPSTLSKYHKKVYTTSRISDDELKQIEFSESYIKFRLKKALGISGSAFTHMSREIYPLGKNLYNLPDNMKLLLETPEQIVIDKKYHRMMELFELEFKQYIGKHDTSEET